MKFKKGCFLFKDYKRKSAAHAMWMVSREKGRARKQGLKFLSYFFLFIATLLYPIICLSYTEQIGKVSPKPTELFFIISKESRGKNDRGFSGRVTQVSQ